MHEMFQSDDKEVELLVDLAMASSELEPLDFKDLNIGEEAQYRLMAAHVKDMNLNLLESNTIVVRLLVENFILNLKLLEYIRKDHQ